MNVNLLSETLEALNEHHKAITDIRWVGNRRGRFAITWDEFAKVADVEYYQSYGSAEVAADLVVVGDDWWLERHEYDGSEWWEFKTLPIMKHDAKPFSKVLNTYGGTLQKAQETA